MLGALAGEPRRITPLGRQLLDLPVHPRLGRLLVAAARDGFLRQGAALAALLSEKDIVPRRLAAPEAGPVAARGARVVRPPGAARPPDRGRARALRSGHARRGGSTLVRPGGLEGARASSQRLGRRLPGATPRPGAEPDEDTMLRWVLLAYPDRVVRRRGPSDATGVMVGGRGVRLAPESVVRDAEFFVALDPREERRGGTREAQVRIASAFAPNGSRSSSRRPSAANAPYGSTRPSSASSV